MIEQRVTGTESSPPGPALAVNAGSTPNLSDKIKAAQAEALSLREIFRCHAICAVFRALWQSILDTVKPYQRVKPPEFKLADFPWEFSTDVRDVFAMALGQEEQRSSRLDTKAGAFLSAAGVLIPLVLTIMSGSVLWVQILFLVAILFSAFAGLAAFRALQTQVGHRLSEKAAIVNGQLQQDVAKRHALTLLFTLKVEEAINDYRVKFINASSTLLVLRQDDSVTIS